MANFRHLLPEACTRRCVERSPVASAHGQQRSALNAQYVQMEAKRMSFGVELPMLMPWHSLLEAPEHMYLIESIRRDLPPQAIEVACQQCRQRLPVR